MSKSSRGKRPCSICRKWFQPDVRQKGRQRTCSKDCSNQLHRRACEKWNKKNREYFKNNALNEKIEKLKEEEEVATQSLPTSDSDPPSEGTPCNLIVLPREIINRELGPIPLIIIEYVTHEIILQIRNSKHAFPS